MIVFLCKICRFLIGMLHILTAPSGEERSPAEDAWAKITKGLIAQNKKLEEAIALKDGHLKTVLAEKKKSETELLQQIDKLKNRDIDFFRMFSAIARASAPKSGPAWAHDEEFLNNLVRLCHPDRHTGDKNIEIANKITGTVLLTLKELKAEAPTRPVPKTPAPPRKPAPAKKRTSR